MAVSVNTAEGATGYACYSSTPISPTSCSSSAYTDFTGGWAVFGCTGSNVKLFYGASGCSATSGSVAVAGNPTFSSIGGQYCWCKMYGTDLGTVSRSWVGGGDYSSASECAYGCVIDCGYIAQYDPDLRLALFSN